MGDRAFMEIQKECLQHRHTYNTIHKLRFEKKKKSRRQLREIIIVEG